MNTQYLEYFITVYRHKNMHRAAQELYVSQQALSKAIKSLENELGVSLFERSSSGMMPTEEGDFFYGKALDIRNAFINAKRDVQLVAKGLEEVRIVCGYSTPYSFYANVGEFQKENPNVLIRWYQVSERIAERMLISGEADIALLSNVSAQDNFIITKLFSQNQRLLVYDNHPLYDKQSIAYTDLIGENIILISPFQQFVTHFETICFKQGFIPNVIVQTPDYYLAHKLCHEKKSIVVSLSDDSMQIGYDNLTEKPFSEESYLSEVSMVQINSRVLNSACKRFEKFICDCYC